MKRWFVLAICLTIQDVRNEGCSVLCMRDGYSGGKMANKGCACIDEKPSYKDYINRSMSLGPAPDVPFTPNQNKSGDINVYFPGKSEYP